MREVEVKNISIANDFSRFPAGRFSDDGDFSGTRFRENELAPALRDPNLSKVVVSFDGVAGFGSSFLEEAFGGLVRAERFDRQFLKTRLEIVTSESDLCDYVRLSWRYIEEAAGVRE